ncbi:Uncharacterised protein [Vibrio cholerae]|nr:Uncharacterised protein [Vibrio cholerae]
MLQLANLISGFRCINDLYKTDRINHNIRVVFGNDFLSWDI